MSFLRGQIFDQNWKHMDNYTISWAGREISFPTFFQIPAVWWEGGSYFGPEDPRVILENVEDAEPVIVFNMILNAPRNPRAMWLYRPFSNTTAVLTIRGEERKPTEKNWAPFFHNDDDSDGEDGISRAPMTDLHFVYSLHPLRVLKCTIEDGACDWVFQQEVPRVLAVSHDDPHGEMRGGTNFVRVPIQGVSGLRVYAGFPRTHLNFCNAGATYRPELVLLAGFGTSFHIAFASTALTFNLSRADNACGEGRMLIPGGILRWDYAHRQDKLDLLLSVSDAQNRVVQIYGLLRFIRKMPYFAKMSRGTSLTDEALWIFPWSVVGNEVLQCSIEAAANSSRVDAGLML
jgi:beta-1,2-mannosyltransferase